MRNHANGAGLAVISDPPSVMSVDSLRLNALKDMEGNSSGFSWFVN